MSDILIIKRIESDIKYRLNKISAGYIFHNGYAFDKENKVKELRLRYCDLNRFPIPITKLVNLKTLDCSHNNIKKIGFQLSNLRKLENFYFSRNKLHKIPLEIINIANLKLLDLSFNNIRILPEEISQLKNLEYLYLSGNKIQDIPESILGLKSLKVLDLRANNIEKIPEWVVNSHLDIVFENDLSTLKNNLELSKLIQSSNFGFESSAFTGRNIFNYDESINLMKDFNKKSTIKFDSKLTIDPPGFISNVEFKPYAFDTAQFNSNFVNSINPDDKYILPYKNEYSKLKIIANDNGILFDYNPITIPDIKIIKQGKKAIANYYLSIREADSEDFLFEAKLIFVGQGFTGKTVLMKTLTQTDYKFNEKEETTKGITVLNNPWKIDIASNKRNYIFQFNIWDFGGQDKYDATHQFFITDRSLYLLLTDARQEFNYHDIHKWLNIIKSQSNNSPVIIIMSKIDEREKSLPQSELKIRFDNIYSFEKVSCLQSHKSTIDTLKVIIKEAIDKLPQTKIKLSNKWINIRNDLEKLSEEHDIIRYNNYLEICRNHNLNEEKAEFLSSYLTSLGVIIHCINNINLRNFIILNLEWSIEGAYKILDDPIVIHNNGVFTNKDLIRIWKETRFNGNEEVLIELMKEYKLCFELRDRQGYLAPELLPPEPPHGIHWNEDNCLVFEYRYDFLPAGIMTRFIVESHALIQDNLYWRYGVVLRHKKETALIYENYESKKIVLSVKGVNKKEMLEKITSIFSLIHSDFQELTYSEMIPCICNKCSKSKSPYFFDYKHILNFINNGKSLISCYDSTEEVKIIDLLYNIEHTKKQSEIIQKIKYTNKMIIKNITINGEANFADIIQNISFNDKFGLDDKQFEDLKNKLIGLSKEKPETIKETLVEISNIKDDNDKVKAGEKIKQFLLDNGITFLHHLSAVAIIDILKHFFNLQ